MARSCFFLGGGGVLGAPGRLQMRFTVISPEDLYAAILNASMDVFQCPPPEPFTQDTQLGNTVPASSLACAAEAEGALSACDSGRSPSVIPPSTASGSGALSTDRWGTTPNLQRHESLVGGTPNLGAEPLDTQRFTGVRSSLGVCTRLWCAREGPGLLFACVCVCAPHVQRTPCPTNTSVRTVFFWDLMNSVLNYYRAPEPRFQAKGLGE